MTTVYIYGLADPTTGQIRYVGRSKDPNDRLGDHHNPKRLFSKTHKNNWIKSLLDKGLRAQLIILEEANESTWKEREKHWIATLPDLTNTTKGGEGEFEQYRYWKIDNATKQKISKSISEYNRSKAARPKYTRMAKTIQGKKKGDNLSTIFCGVVKTVNNTYLSYISKDRKRIYIGIYTTAEDAARAYDIKALELFGPDAHLNLPQRVGEPPPISAREKKSSSCRGVNFQDNRWVAVIHINGEKRYLGSFPSEEEACAAVANARQASPKQ